jgi:hypothetical protein
MQNFVAKLKNAWRSKTVWFNAGAGLALAYSNEILQLMPQLQPVLGADHFQAAITTITIANVVLRFVTTHPLEAK